MSTASVCCAEGSDGICLWFAFTMQTIQIPGQVTLVSVSELELDAEPSIAHTKQDLNTPVLRPLRYEAMEGSKAGGGLRFCLSKIVAEARRSTLSFLLKT